jgi:hypothetical protein
MVTKPDRLALSTMELLAIEADMSKRKIRLVVQLNALHLVGAVP